jgi:hypothetical protein
MYDWCKVIKRSTQYYHRSKDKENRLGENEGRFISIGTPHHSFIHYLICKGYVRYFKINAGIAQSV